MNGLANKIGLLLKYAEQINREKDVDVIIPTIAQMAKELVGTDRMSLFLVDENNKKLYTIVSHGVDRIEVSLDKGIVGYCAMTGESVIVQDAYADPRFNREVDKATGYTTKNIIAVPLFDSKKRVMGVFQGINKLDGSFTEEDLEMLNLLAGYASSTIENKRLSESIKRAYEETVNRLSFAAEYKDPETYNHILRIGLMAELLAKRLNMPEEYCYNIRLAAPMHDIGKIGIPDNILLKKGKLDSEEWEVMKSHTIIGYNILKDSESPLLQMAAMISLEHHEKWDGTGYPYQKKGEEISLEARITSIVDVFDALTSERPYKPAWSIEETVNYMKSLRGTHFDPNLLDLLFENLSDIQRIKETYKDE